MGDKKLKALIIDDEKVVRDFLVRFLQLKGLQAKAAESGNKAVEFARKEKFNIIFLEISIPNDGIQIIKTLKKINPQARCVAMTANPKDEILEEARKEGISVCLKKPFDLAEIIFEINQLE